MSNRFPGRLPLAVLTCGLLQVLPVAAQDVASSSPAPNSAIETVVVTANKREQSANSVGMTLQALSGDDLAQRGITSTADLVKVVPGFTSSNSGYGTTIYTLRGIGLNDYGLASSPAVAVYLDEAPLSFPAMVEVAPLDLQRVEVLKGPQGILFGESSTGGAINYIAAKPTDKFEAGGSVSVSNYGRIDANAYVSGPLSDTVSARLSVGAVSGGAWQYSTTRDDHLGNADVKQGRLIVDWQPSDSLKVSLNINGYVDNSDIQAPQLTVIHPAVPALAAPAFLAHPIVTGDDRAADWDADWPMNKDDGFVQVALRADYKLSSDITLTSLSSYQHMNVLHWYDYDATQVPDANSNQSGTISSFNQEIRLAGDFNRLNWLVGASYEHADVDDNVLSFIPDYTAGQPIPTLPRLQQVNASVDQTIDNYGVFANGDYQFTDHLSGYAGLRYSVSDRHGTNCNYDGAPGNEAGQIFVALQQAFAAAGLKTTPVVPIGAFDCYQLDSNFDPGPYHNKLNADNVSARFGINYKLDDGTLFYANFRRGFKDGIIPVVPASSTSQFAPAKQERLDAWEAGIKAPLLNGLLQFNGAAFYYDYSDKQVLGTYVDPIFGLLTREINVPKSELWGLEGELVAHPLDGLALSANLTYIHSEVTSDFENFNQQGLFGNFKGSPLPFSPELSAAADGQYTWLVSSDFNAFVGAAVTYHGADNTTFHNSSLPAPDFKIKPYALLDLRAGIGPEDGPLADHAVGPQYHQRVLLDNRLYRYGLDLSLYRYACHVWRDCQPQD